MFLNYRKYLVIMLMLIFATALNGVEAKNKKGKLGYYDRLEKGEVLISIKKHPKTGVANPTGQCLITASAEDVWHVITDFDSFGKFLPNVIYYKPYKWEKGRLIVNCKVKIAFFTSKYKLSYFIDEKNHTTYWSYVKKSGPIRDAQGYWRIKPYDDKRVIITYTTTMDIGRLVPGWLERRVSKSTFPKVFTSLRNRVKELKKRGPIKKPKLRFWK